MATPWYPPSNGELCPEVAESFIGTPGAFVDLETTINDFEEVVVGRFE